jgi:hypothetical protein
MLDSGNELEWGKLATLTRKVIPQVDGMLDRKRPQFRPTLVRPVKNLMHQHSTIPSHDGPDDALSGAILMMGTNSTAGHGLTLHLEVVKAILHLMKMVIGTVGLDADTICTCKPFKCMLGLEGFSYTQRHLVRQVQIARCMIMENCTTMVLLGDTFLSFRVGKAARVCAVALARGDTVTRLKIITLDSHFHSRLQ